MPTMKTWLLTFGLLSLPRASLATTDISLEIRAFWMRQAVSALGAVTSPCPFEAFGSVVVNHTAPPNFVGDLVCIGANQINVLGDPTLHGQYMQVREAL